jgi:hypothetical protein
LRSVLPMARSEISCDGVAPLLPLEWSRSSPSDSGSHCSDLEFYRRDLGADHARILRLLGYVSWEYSGWVQAHDRVPAVLAARRDIGSGASAAGF